MTQTVSDFIVERLYEWGVRRLYGYSGDGINGLMGALRRSPDKLRLVQARHEELAAFMACGDAKYGQKLGVCVATSGPGAIHLLNGLYDAHKDHMPVLAIVGQQARMSLGAEYQQEIDLPVLYKDVAHQYVQMVSTPAQARHVVDQAVRIASARRCVTCIILPSDVQDAEMQEPPRKHGATFSGVGYRQPQQVPAEEDLERAAALLNAGERIAIMVGAGIRDAVDELLGVADTLGAGVAKALLAKTMVPDELPFVTGAMGLLGTEPSAWMMSECDTLLMIGTRFPYAEFLPAGDQAHTVQIDLAPEALGLRHPTDVSLQGDSAATLKALAPLLKKRKRKQRKWRDQVEKRVAEWWQTMESRAANEGDPINPQRVLWALSPRLPDNVMIASDVGSVTNWYARYLKIRRGMIGSVSGGLASMGCGVPYIVAAKFCHPHRPAIALVGDGAMQMLGNNGLISIAKYWREWENPRLIVLVLNNRDLNQVTWEQRVMEGDPKFETSQDVPDFAYDEYANVLGLKGLRMSRTEDVERVWDEALAADRPVVINAYTDADTPPLPPHISFEQAKNYMSALAKGDPDRIGEIKQSVKAMAARYFDRSPNDGD